MTAKRTPSAQELSDVRNAVSMYVPSRPVPVQATTDGQVVEMWLHGKSDATRKGYAVEVERFGAFVQCGIQEVTLGHIQQYADSLNQYATATQARSLSAVKSLFTFAQRIGYVVLNPAAAVTTPKRKDTLAERIMSEYTVQRIIATTTGRNHAIVRLLYSAGIRVSELCGLTWRDVQPRNDSGQITVFGKGSKTRAVLLSAEMWNVVQSLRPVDAAPDAPVFTSRKGHGRLTPVQVFRIVRDAAAAAGVEGNVSPHWLRHSHASHAADKGCPIHVIQATLGHASVSTTSRYLHARPDASSSQYIAA